MNARQYDAALQLSTEAALKGGQISLPEIIGSLHLVIIQTERIAYQHAIAQRLREEGREATETTNLIIPPNGIALPMR